MKKTLLCLAIALCLNACTRDRAAETRATDNAHSFIEQIFNARW